MIGPLIAAAALVATLLGSLVGLTWRFGALVATLQKEVATLQNQIGALRDLEQMAARVPDLERRQAHTENEIVTLREQVVKLRIDSARARAPSVAD